MSVGQARFVGSPGTHTCVTVFTAHTVYYEQVPAFLMGEHGVSAVCHHADLVVIVVVVVVAELVPLR